MTNILLNKIYENLITISRTKDNMDECVQDNKSYYEKDIKTSIDEIKTLLDELYLLTQKDLEPIETMQFLKSVAQMKVT